jgi:hypothetical protein
MDVAEARRLKDLESENEKFKRLFELSAKRREGIARLL